MDTSIFLLCRRLPPMAQGFQKLRRRTDGILPGLLPAGGSGKCLFRLLSQTALGHQVRSAGLL